MSYKKNILIYESLGFLILIVWCWIEELVDINHILFNNDPTDFNIIEAVEETIIILIIGSIILYTNNKILNRLKILEGIVPTCSFCKKVRIEDKWQPIDSYLNKNSDLKLSHGFCPECIDKNYSKLFNKK